MSNVNVKGLSSRRAAPLVLMIALSGVFAFTGCQSSGRRTAASYSRKVDKCPCRAGAIPYGKSVLLAASDRGPAVPDPESFAFRSTWPSIDGAYQLGQVITYRERWYNYQSLQSGRDINTYKRFESYRTGTEFR